MEKNTLAGENDKAIRSISIIRSLLNDDSFKMLISITKKHQAITTGFK